MADKTPSNCSDTHEPSSSQTIQANYEGILDPEDLRPWEPWRPFDPDRWRCLRYGPVSGRYRGPSTSPDPNKWELELRVDLDPVHRNSPVTNRISADVYQVYTFNWGGRTFTWRVYRSSWIVENPTVSWSRCSVAATGNLRYWKGAHLRTSFSMQISWSTFQRPGPAEVTIQPLLGNAVKYTCKRESSYFRDLDLEVDVCKSVNAEPILPSYDTHSHPTRPNHLPQRTLDLVESYRESGIDVTISPDRTIIDDSAAKFATWNVSELHDAMETHFSQFSGSWPKWKMWGLLCGRFDSSSVAGIMFDAKASFGGAGEPPDRQGFAVFREHSWFDDLVQNPSNDAEAEAMRQYLYTWVHEAGHAFNMLHSWNKGRANSLSWMNYPQRVANFWNNFEMRFDEEELIHMRHGDRAAVIMGGDEWASGGHLHDLSEGGRIEGSAPVEVLVRSKGYFEFLEPVSVEVRLRNLTSDVPIELQTRLSPEFGLVAYQIRKPDGNVVEYDPLAEYIAEPEMRTLAPTADDGSDRYSQQVFLHYGPGGFVFDQPGIYNVRAVYFGVDGLVIPSASHQLRVGVPATKEADRLAQDYFSYEVGLSLYLGGSKSPHLQKGMNVLRECADRFSGSGLAAAAATTVAQSEGRDHFRIEKNKLKRSHEADPEAALELTEPVLEQYRKEDDKAYNLPYHAIVRQRSQLLAEAGKKKEAKKEVETLGKDLSKRGVRPAVISEIKAYAKKL